jgi:hypothetical protein
MGNAIRKTLAVMTFSLCFMGFHPSATIGGQVQPPYWVKGEPKIEGMICAVGISGPTYFKDDAQSYAAENGRKELAKFLSIRINTIMLDVATPTGSTVDEATVMQVSSWSTAVSLEKSQVIEYWYDADGAMPAGKKMTYALCCLSKKQYRSGLEENLGGGDRLGDRSSGENNRPFAETLEKITE